MEELLKKIIVEALQSVTAAPHVEQKQEIMTATQLAEYLQVSVSWVHKNVSDIPHVKVGGTRFRKQDIDKWLEDRVVISGSSEKIHISTAKKKNSYKVV